MTRTCVGRFDHAEVVFTLFSSTGPKISLDKQRFKPSFEPNLGFVSVFVLNSRKHDSGHPSRLAGSPAQLPVVASPSTSHRLNIKSPLKHLRSACVRRARRSVCRAASGIPPARAAGSAGRGRSGRSPVRGRRGPRLPCAGCVCAGAGRPCVLQPPAARAACERAIACRSPRASACVQTHARQSIASGACCELDQKLQACMHVRESPYQPQSGV